MIDLARAIRSALGTALVVATVGAAVTSTGGEPAAPGGSLEPEFGAVWVWPVVSREVVRGFEPGEHRWSRAHRGIDILGQGGEPVSAVDDGVVAHSGVINGVGTITVRHTPDLRSTYQPVSDQLSVGAEVAQGEVIAVLSADGHCPPQECLHLGAIVGVETYVDPLSFLRPGVVSLLPLDG